MSKQNQSTTSSMPLIAAIFTVVLVIGAIVLLTLDRLDVANGRSIEEAAQTPLTLPLVCAGLLLIAIGWLYWLIKHHGFRHIVTLVVTGIAAILLVATPLLAWQVFNNERDLTIVSMTCDAESLRNTGGAVLANCEEDAVETIVLLQGVTSDDQWIPDDATGNLTREFHGLPGGEWETMLTVDGPPDTVAIAAVGQKGDESIRLGNFRPYMDTESERLRWSALVPIAEDIDTVQVLFYLSANPAVESASIRFDMRECQGQTLRSFDASQCEPMETSAPLVVEKSPEGTRTWRHPHVAREGSEMVITNLEARTYELQPDYPSIQLYSQSTDVLIIPSAMEQTEANSLTEPGASSFDVTVTESSAALTYTIYVFPTGPTFAGVDP